MGGWKRPSGQPENFPRRVSSVLSGADPSAPGAREARDRFFAQYWRPVYKFIPDGGRASIEDAKDLTQEFFSYLLEGGLLQKYRHEKGASAAFSKELLAAPLRGAARRGRAEARGGRTFVSLDVAALETGEAAGGRRTSSATASGRATCSRRAGRAPIRLPAEGKGDCLRVYEAYELAPAQEGISYGSVGRALGLTEHQVKSHLERPGNVWSRSSANAWPGASRRRASSPTR